MPENEKSKASPPLRYYSGSWWKVEGAPIWLLAGPSDENLPLGWYFHDETSDLIGPFESRELAEDALESYYQWLQMPKDCSCPKC